MRCSSCVSSTIITSGLILSLVREGSSRWDGNIESGKNQVGMRLRWTPGSASVVALPTSAIRKKLPWWPLLMALIMILAASSCLWMCIIFISGYEHLPRMCLAESCSPQSGQLLLLGMSPSWKYGTCHIQAFPMFQIWPHLYLFVFLSIASVTLSSSSQVYALTGATLITAYLFAVYNSSHAVKSISFQESERSAIKELLRGTCLLDTLPEYACVRSSTIGAYHLQCHMLLLACMAGPHAQLPELSRSTQLLCWLVDAVWGQLEATAN